MLFTKEENLAIVEILQKKSRNNFNHLSLPHVSINTRI